MSPAGLASQLVIFDCDGVLVDSERLAHESLCELLAECGLAMGMDEAIERFIGTSDAVLVERVGRLLPVMPADFLDRFHERCHARFKRELQAIPGVARVLDAMEAPYCVASNGRHADVALSLGHTGLLRRFSGRIFCAEDVARPKPAPDLFLHAARSMAASPSHCVVVEDTPTGIRAARAAGMHALGYAAMTPSIVLEEAGAHAVFHDMEALPGLIRAALGRLALVTQREGT